MSAKKLVQGVGFGKKKDTELIIVLDTGVDTIKDVVRETIQDNVDVGEIVNEHDSVEEGILKTDEYSVSSNTLTMEQSSTLSTTLETPINTIQSPMKYSVQIPIKNEKFSSRLVANVTKKQKTFVQEMSKKFENESSFVRFMISSFMKDIDFKENKAGK